MPMLLATALLALQLAGPVAAPPDPPAEPAAASPAQEQKAEAKEPPTPAHTGLHALFGNLVEDVKHLPSMENAYIATIGGGLALAAHPLDSGVNGRLQSHDDAVDDAFAAGKKNRNTPEQISLSLRTHMFRPGFHPPKGSPLRVGLI